MSLLFGCRAFEPEAVIVNRLPETYIIGSPAETSGAYFHFRVFWYGTDSDGYVERYMWALTDTSIQDIETDEDEEDERFNPATNVNTREIGTYTTRTDTVFDFQINQGPLVSYDMTLHLAAMDDRGEFDRTPARLRFFSNALGNPVVNFYRSEINPDSLMANYDTLAFGEPLFLRWAGTTPNLSAYDPVLLAERDTVFPFDDGLFGFKWRLPAFEDCNDAQEDCWNPKAFDEATGDSFSYFGDVTGLNFLNDDSGDGPFTMRHDAGRLELLVNTLDVAGVQVPANKQSFYIVINYEPDTYILRGETDPAYPDDTRTYPYYTVFHGGDGVAGDYTFMEGDTVPDGAYVVFKALGWDDPRDQILEPDSTVQFQGLFVAGQNIQIDGIYNTFNTSYSALHHTAEWTAENPTDISSDTLGFEVGPFNYDVVMRSADENLTRDGTPDTFSFVGNFPPCVQAIEVMNNYTEAFMPTAVYEGNCYDDVYLEEFPELKVYSSFSPEFNNHFTDPTVLRGNSANSGSVVTGNIYVSPNSGAISLSPEPPVIGDWTPIISYYYAYVMYLSGKDHPKERWPDVGQNAHQRIKSWKYQVDCEADFGNNTIADGGGQDNISFLSMVNIEDGYQSDPIYGPMYGEPGLFILQDSGIWGIEVNVCAPLHLILSGATGHWNEMLNVYNAPDIEGTTQADTLAWQATPEVQKAFSAYMLTTMQFSRSTVQVLAADQADCNNRDKTNTYHYYNQTRVPENDLNRRQCQPKPNEIAGLDLRDYIAYSDDPDGTEPDRNSTSKSFNITLYANDGSPGFNGGSPPPNWITTTANQVSWR